MKKITLLALILSLMCSCEKHTPHFSSIPLISFIQGEWICSQYREEYKDTDGNWVLNSSHSVDYTRVYTEAVCTIHMNTSVIPCMYSILGEAIIHNYGGAVIELDIERISYNEVLFIYNMGDFRNVVKALRGIL